VTEDRFDQFLRYAEVPYQVVIQSKPIMWIRLNVPVYDKIAHAFFGFLLTTILFTNLGQPQLVILLNLAAITLKELVLDTLIRRKDWKQLDWLTDTMGHLTGVVLAGMFVATVASW